MSNIAIIPARGGSKRIPRKNIKDFLGKPIIAYSIEAAINSGLFEEVMVSTDDKEIAEVAKRYGAKVPFLRSKLNSNDYATLANVVEEVLYFYETEKNWTPKLIATILPTAPFVKIKNLIKGISMFSDSRIDSVMSVGKYPTPIFRSLRLDESGNLIKNFPEHINSRSQDLPTTFYDAGQFYITKTEIFKAEKRLSCGICKPFLLLNNQIQDIDTTEDWQEAEFKYKAYFDE